jgi:glycosyltransferase involved in cell wall biosynthesis
MHVLFVHQNYPAQFGYIADYLAREKGWRCTFVSMKPGGREGSVERIQYTLKGRATERNHYCSRTFENGIWHAHAVYEALKARRDIRPDLIVGHSGFGSTLFLRELYDVPIVNYFEYFYRSHDSDMDFRPDFPSSELDQLRARARNAMVLLDLENCDLGYSPTLWQRSLLPSQFQDKVSVIYDGVDCEFWKPIPRCPRQIGSRVFPDHVKIVSYVARGMESIRGFDIFMRAAKRLCDYRKDVIFLIAGEDEIHYGGDRSVIGTKTFKEWVLSRDDYDLSRFHFLGIVPPGELVKLFNITDLHVYLTVPFVLSWSLMNALACGATVIASDTEPVREMIEDGENGLLAGFFDLDRILEIASDVLDEPASFHTLGQTGARKIREHYSQEVCLARMQALYETACRRPV